MPERDTFAHAWDENPFEDMNAYDAYQTLRWGHEPEAVFELEGPEPKMAALGELARLEFPLENGGSVVREWDEDEAPYLAVGLDSRRLYVIPRDAEGDPLEDLRGSYNEVGEVSRTDYIAVKGDDDAYWYHSHEEPFPSYFENPETGAGIIEPADNDGAPSFVVAEEGIIG